MSTKTSKPVASKSKYFIHIGDKVKELAKEKGYKTEDIANWFGWSRNNIYKKLSKWDWSFSDICVVSGHLGVSPAYFVEKEPTPYTQSEHTPMLMTEPEVVYKTKLESLEEQLKLKDEIISLLKSKK